MSGLNAWIAPPGERSNDESFDQNCHECEADVQGALELMTRKWQRVEQELAGLREAKAQAELLAQAVISATTVPAAKAFAHRFLFGIQIAEPDYELVDTRLLTRIVDAPVEDGQGDRIEFLDGERPTSVDAETVTAMARELLDARNAAGR